MKSVTFLVVTELSVFVFIFAQTARESNAHNHNAFGYFQNIGIPKAKQVYEEENSELMPRIVGGEAADIVEYNYQAGLLITIKDVGTGLCGGSIIKDNLICTAAHCWDDGNHRGSGMTVVLGSNKVFSGGTRINTCKVYMHPGWEPPKAINDVAVAYLPTAVTFSDKIAVIALPSKYDVHKNYVGESVIATGYGRTGQNNPVQAGQFLSKVTLTVISNEECLEEYPTIITPSNICTSGNSTHGHVAICNGDSGGPLVHLEKKTPTLVGISSFGGRGAGCDESTPNAYSRVTSYLDFLQLHMNDNNYCHLCSSCSANRECDCNKKL